MRPRNARIGSDSEEEKRNNRNRNTKTWENKNTGNFVRCEILDFWQSTQQITMSLMSRDHPGGFSRAPAHMPPYCPIATWRSTVFCEHNTPTSPTAERELRPTALINRTGCWLLSWSQQSPPPCRRAWLSAGYTSLPRGVIHTQKYQSYTRAFTSSGHIYCWVIAMACQIFLESTKLILVAAGLTLAFSDSDCKNNSSVFDILLKCNGWLKETESLCTQRHRPASVQDNVRHWREPELSQGHPPCQWRYLSVAIINTINAFLSSYMQRNVLYIYSFNRASWVMGQGGREWQQMYGVQGEISEVWGYRPRSSFLHWLAHSVGFSMPYRLVQGTYMLWLMHHWAEANALKQELSKKMDLEGASELYKDTLTHREAHIFCITHSLSLFFPFVCTHIENTYKWALQKHQIWSDSLPTYYCLW